MPPSSPMVDAGGETAVDDPVVIGHWLGELLGEGAKPVAVISLLINIYLWRALRTAEQRHNAVLEEEIKLLRAEAERTKTADNRVFEEMAGLVRMLHRRQSTGAIDAPAPRSLGRRRAMEEDDESELPRR